MDRVLNDLAEQHAELDRLTAGLDEQQWRLASRCAGWTIADVVLHLAQTDRLALASVQDRFVDVVTELTAGLEAATSVDDGADRMVARERGDPGAVVAGKWRTGASELRAALANDDPHRRVQWVAGQLRCEPSCRRGWPRHGSTPVTSPPPSASSCLRPTGSSTSLGWRGGPCRTRSRAPAGRSAGPVAFDLRAPSGEAWSFVPDDEPVTTIRGGALDLCLLAGRRVRPTDTALTGDGPDAIAVLDLVRTYA